MGRGLQRGSVVGSVALPVGFGGAPFCVAGQVLPNADLLPQEPSAACCRMKWALQKGKKGAEGQCGIFPADTAPSSAPGFAAPPHSSHRRPVSPFTGGKERSLQAGVEFGGGGWGRFLEEVWGLKGAA